jgi:hypothetical protein
MQPYLPRLFSIARFGCHQLGSGEVGLRSGTSEAIGSFPWSRVIAVAVLSLPKRCLFMSNSKSEIRLGCRLVARPTSGVHFDGDFDASAR